MEVFDRYWKPLRYEDCTKATLTASIAKKGYSVKGSLSKQEVIELHHRIDKRLISYYECTEEELLGFNRSRRLSIGRLHSKAPKKKQLIDHLLIADNNPKFEKFLHLPPELRARIYDFYSSSLPQVLHTPSQPPLARTCQAIRNECLPTFYAEHTFSITLETRNLTSYPKFHYDQPSTIFLSISLSPAAMSEIRCIQANIIDRRRLSDRRQNENLLGRFNINLSNQIGPTGYYLKVENGPSRWGGITPARSRENLESELRRVLDQLRTTQKGKEFSFSDMFALRAAVETACR